MLWRCAHFDDLQAPIQVLAASTHQDINMQKGLSCHPTYSYNNSFSYDCDDRVAVMIDNPRQIYPLKIQPPQKKNTSTYYYYYYDFSYPFNNRAPVSTSLTTLNNPQQREENTAINYDNHHIPISQNKPLKQKITAFAIFFTYAVLTVEYFINPHSIYTPKNNGERVIMPPCVVIEPYVGYNIFLLGLPLASFMHLKLSLYQYHCKYGFLVFMEFIMATIIMSYDKIKKIHSADTLLLILATFFIMLDFTNRKNICYPISYFISFIILSICILTYDYVNKTHPQQYDNFHNIIYLTAFVLWVAFQWPLCTEYTASPNGYETYLGFIVFVSGLITVVLSNVYPNWQFFFEKRFSPLE